MRGWDSAEAAAAVDPVITVPQVDERPPEPEERVRRRARKCGLRVLLTINHFHLSSVPLQANEIHSSVWKPPSCARRFLIPVARLRTGNCISAGQQSGT